MIDKERPVVVAIHKDLEKELKERQNEMRNLTGRKSRGGLTVFSRLAAFELKMIRESGQEISKKINNLNSIKVENINGNKYVPYEWYKKLYILCSILNKKKDSRQIKIDVTKIKGLKKNELNFFY